MTRSSNSMSMTVMIMMMMVGLFVVAATNVLFCDAFTPKTTTASKSISKATTTRTSLDATPMRTTAMSTRTTNNPNSWFPQYESTASLREDQLKAQILQLGASLDRGQAYNPTSGQQYLENLDIARYKIEQLCELTRSDSTKLPTSMQDLEGEWELVLSTVPHGIFRSSPFFLAIQESYEYAVRGNGRDKANLFFKLHELQTCSWGTSKIGRVAQRIDMPSRGSPASLKTDYYLYSEFDTTIFSLTVIPILGWFKLLPTFGGCVVTAAACELLTFTDSFGRPESARLDMEVDYTTSRKVPGLKGLPLLGDLIWKINVPVGKIWKALPWNKGRAAICSVFIRYLDDDFRIVQDIDGEYFVYTRPVISRDLDYV
eukprot:CAMPEP_0113479328 /NCGR_PEP_ID=MMETSP0014_2-20120614/21248_1 /TAXON_ID=2857 /ORGANISM="Nitzschia sp." /LENGTH=371 /DNA_ID=CAMNT_0000372613 /DNA_START=217 /DNA_END=1332 /DNA_ORIENTATION=+ /assembly_acc=CAM_ASM_000159